VSALGKALAASATIAALALFAFAAQAQQKAPEKAEPTAKTAKPKSVCNSITEETACKANATCTWIAAVMDKQSGKQKRRAYCKTKPKPPVKKTKEPTKK
jgi:hypothetical protein